MSRHAPVVAPWPRADAWLARLEAAGWPTVGRSVLGRPLVAREWGEGACTLIVGVVHGDEPAGALACYRLAEAMPAATGRVIVLPVLNPDGLVRHTKDNARGVDLNRNLPTHDFGSERRPGYEPGASPGSEPETRALLELIDQARPVRVLAVHQPFACVNFDGPAREWATRISEATRLPVSADIGYPTPGSLGTFLGVELGIPVITLELGPGSPAQEAPRARTALEAALRSPHPGAG